MRIVSLLPSATEIVFALGAGDDLVGVSGDCDYPAGAGTRPVVSHSSLDLSGDESPGSIDAAVRGHVTAAQPIYRLDRELVRSLKPDLIVAQDLCRVCAVPSGHVTEALHVIGWHADVLSLDPHSLDDVLDGIEQVADATGRSAAGHSLVTSLRRRLDAVASRSRDLAPVPTLALEWADPPFAGGHWVPEMVSLAGGRDVLGVAGAPSRQYEWEEIAAAMPEVTVFMPCGYGLDDAIAQGRRLPKGVLSGPLWAVDGSAYFSRPGPRLVDGVELLAWILHPDAFPAPPPGRAAHLTA